jgi:CheY-like chemotaxis protein
MTSSNPERLSGVHVLVVEDVAALRALARLMLEAEGATVVEAPTGQDALALARAQVFDIAMTDLGLPDMPGVDVITGIRAASGGRTPVTVISGAPAEDLTRALEVGAERAFSKPMDWEEVLPYLERRTKTPVSERARAESTKVGATVLIVEDDDAMRAMLRDALEREGYEVIERPDGDSLAILLEGEPCDAVVLDKEMPGGPNGLDLLAFLRTRFPALPVILVTAFGGPDIAREARLRGAHTYLEKPFRVAAILDTLAAAVNQARDARRRG